MIFVLYDLENKITGDKTMISPLSAATTALSAFNKKMSSTANNIANVISDGYKKSRVNLQEGANGGVTAQVQQIDTPGPLKETIQNGEVVETESSNVDLAEELTEMIPTKAAYSANLKSIRTQEEMMGSLLDILG